MRGFTLIEVMVVIAILGIIASIAIPGIQDMTANNRQMTTANEFVSNFHYARDQASLLHRDVLIKAIGNDWKNGWTITALAYTETDLTGNVIEHSEKPLLSRGAVPQELIITASVTSLQITTTGWLLIPSSKTITFCDKRKGETGRVLTIEPIGNISTSYITCG